MRLLDDLRRELHGFIAGRDHGVLRLHSSDDHLIHVHQLLGEHEPVSPDIHLLFPNPFTSADPLATLVETTVASPRTDAPPALRIRAALAHARDQLPTGPAAPRLVVALCPLSGRNPAYHDLVDALLAPTATTAPWFHRMRLLVLADPARRTAPHPLVRSLAVDLSPDAMARSLRAEADDPATRPDARIKALLQLAGLDHAHRRFAAAEARYHELLALAGERPLYVALALLGLGDVDRTQRRTAAAQAHYERALEPAGAARAPIVLLLIARNLGHLYFETGRRRDAEACFTAVDAIAERTGDSESRRDAQAWQARCRTP